MYDGYSKLVRWKCLVCVMQQGREKEKEEKGQTKYSRKEAYQLISWVKVWSETNCQRQQARGREWQQGPGDGLSLHRLRGLGIKR